MRSCLHTSAPPSVLCSASSPKLLLVLKTYSILRLLEWPLRLWLHVTLGDPSPIPWCYFYFFPLFFFTKYTNSYIFISNHTVIAFRKDVTCTSPFIPSVWDLPPIRTPPHPTSQYSAVSASGLRACPEQGTSLELKSYRTYGVWVFTSLWLQLLFTSICTASRTVPTKRESLHMPPSYAHCLRLYWPASDDQNTGY